MKKNNLISMTDFVIQELKGKVLYHHLEKVVNYADFLSKKLELWMFVPCKLVDGVWVVMEEPKEYKYACSNPSKELMEDVEGNYKLELKEYQEAKENCIFNDNLLSLDKIKELIQEQKTVEFLINYYYEETGSYLETNRQLF